MADRTAIKEVPMVNLVDKARYADNDEILVIYCDNICQKRGVQNDQVDGFCVDCMEYLCSMCRECHKINLPGHKQYDKHEMPKDICTDTCHEHRGKFIKFYCESCDDFICINCKCGKHKDCANVYFLPLLIQNIENGDNFKDFENRLTQIESKYDKTEISHNKSWGRILKYKTNGRTVLKSQKQELMEEFDNATSNVNRIIQETFNDNKERHTKIHMQVKMIGEEIYTIKNNISYYKKTKQRFKLFKAMKKSIPNIDALDERLEKARSQSKCTVTEYFYKPEKPILEGLYVGEIEVNGVIKPSDDCQRLKIQDKCREIEKKEIEVKQKSKENEENTKTIEQLSREAEQYLREVETRAGVSEKYLRENERKSKEAEQTLREAERKSKEAEHNYLEAYRKLREAEIMSRDAKNKLRDSEQKSMEIERNQQRLDGVRDALTTKSREANEKSRQADIKSREADQTLKEAEQKSREAEQTLIHAEQKINEYQKILKQVEDKSRDADKKSRAAEVKTWKAEQKSREVEQSLRDAEQKLREVENKSREAEEKLNRAEQKSVEAEQNLKQAEQISQKAEKQSCEAEQRSLEAQQNSWEAEQKSWEAEHKSWVSEQKSREAEQKSLAAEQIINEYERKSIEAEQNSLKAELKSREAKAEIEQARNKVNALRLRWIGLTVLSMFISIICVSGIEYKYIFVTYVAFFGCVYRCFDMLL